MAGIATAIAGSAVLGLGGALIGANATDTASSRSADAQRYAADQSTGFQREQAAQAREDFAPYKQAGYDALDKLKTFVPGESAAAQWQLQQGTKSLNRQLAARGLLGGGNAANRLSELQQSIAAKDYDSQYGRLTDMLKVGQGAAGSINNSGMNAANNMSSAAQNLGTGLANTYTNQGNNQASLYSGIGGAAMNATALGIKGGMFDGGSGDTGWNGSTGVTEGYNTPYAGATVGPWAAPGVD